MKYIGIGSASKKWHRCITTTHDNPYCNFHWFIHEISSFNIGDLWYFCVVVLRAVAIFYFVSSVKKLASCSQYLHASRIS